MATYVKTHIWNSDVTMGSHKKQSPFVEVTFLKSKTAMHEDKTLWENWDNGKQRHET